MKNCHTHTHAHKDRQTERQRDREREREEMNRENITPTFAFLRFFDRTGRQVWFLPKKGDEEDGVDNAVVLHQALSNNHLAEIWHADQCRE